MNHNEPYSADYLKDILSSVKTIAMVGASPDKTKFSYGVLRVLHETGYDMIPVNPKPGIKEIRKQGGAMIMIDCDVENGGMKINKDFIVDFGKEPNGPSRCHESRYPGGDCTSDIWL